MIIKAALKELKSDFTEKGFNVYIIDTENNRDILDEKIAEYGLLENYGKFELLGQIALVFKSHSGTEDIAVIGYNETTFNMYIVNPKFPNYLSLDLHNLEKIDIKECVLKILFPGE